MEKKRAIPLSREELNRLLIANHEKVMEALTRNSAEMEAADPIGVAYMAGRLEGMADAMLFRERSA